MIISKNNPSIAGRDSIISIGLNQKKILYNIRFHLTPNCSCLLTNNKKSVLIKTKLRTSLDFWLKLGAIIISKNLDTNILAIFSLIFLFSAIILPKALVESEL